MAEETEKSKPKIKERFIYTPSFRGKKVRMLNSDGYLDYAYQMGLVSLIPELIRERETTATILKTDDFGKIEHDGDNNPIMLTITTRWVLFKATAVVHGPNGELITAVAHAEVNDKDTKAVKDPWHLASVAETRAIKRVLASACCITEELISPHAKGPTREAEGLEPEGDEDPDIPQKVRTKVDITPPLSKEVEHTPPGKPDEWDLS